MKRFLGSLYLQVLVAVALGALLGFLNPPLGAAMKPLGDGFIKLVIPPELGFGKQGVGSVVPPNAVLFYEFELLGVR